MGHRNRDAGNGDGRGGGGSGRGSGVPPPTSRPTPTGPVLQLLTAAPCPFAQRVVLALAAAGLPYTSVPISLYGAGGKPAWFTALHPPGTVPVLLVYPSPVGESAVEAVAAGPGLGGKGRRERAPPTVVAGSQQILTYLRTAHGAGAGADAASTAAADGWREWVDERLAPSGRAAVEGGGLYGGRRGGGGGGGGGGVPPALAAELDWADAALRSRGNGGGGGGPLVGAVWSAADSAVVPFVLRLDETIGLASRWPGVAAYAAWARTVPAVRHAWVDGWWWWW
ncbi:hypothetical protein MMPV_005990 [Pyropia vietnamensis]